MKKSSALPFVKSFGFVLLFGFMLSGCVVDRMGGFNAFEGREFSEEQSDVIALDILKIVKLEYAPGKMVMSLVDSDTLLNQMVETKLRLSGYAVYLGENEIDNSYTTIDYAVEELTKNIIILRVSLDKNKEVGLVYELKKETLIPKKGYTRISEDSLDD